MRLRADKDAVEHRLHQPGAQRGAAGRRTHQQKRDQHPRQMRAHEIARQRHTRAAVRAPSSRSGGFFNMDPRRQCYGGDRALASAAAALTRLCTLADAGEGAALGRSGRIGDEALIRGKNVGLDVVVHNRTPIEPFHRPHQSAPVQHLVLPGLLHRLQRALAPGVVIALRQRVEQQPVGLWSGHR